MIKRNLYTLGIKNQTTRFFIILISIVSSITHAGLIFEFQGTKQFELNEEGKFSEAVINANVAAVPSSSALLFDHQGQTTLWAENDHTINLTENFEAKTSAFPATGLLVQNTAMLQVAEILPIGRLYIAGENRQLVSAVAYADATALLEWNPSLGGYELKYHNIITPEGIEGRIEYPGNAAIYYIKDHLGSIREVISEQGAMSESVQYHSYGNQDKTLVSSVETRETFTGKEYDEDGEVNGAAGINLYYFGARFFDPETGIWNGIDPAERLFNPFAYCGGNPVSLVDPNGEDFGLSAAIVGAIIAAAVATASASVTAIQENQNFGDWLWNVFWQSNVAGLIGFASGGMGSLAASTASGTIGGFWGGVASGAASGYTSAFISYTGNYLMDYAKSGFDEDYFDNIDEAGKGFFKSMVIGVGISAVAGGITSFLPKDEATLTTETKDVVSTDASGNITDTKPSSYSHAAIEGKYKGQDYKISVGPLTRRTSPFGTVKGDYEWATHSSDGLGRTIRLPRVNGKRLFDYAQELERLGKNGTLLWNPQKYSCVQYASEALRKSGALSAGISVHPYWLHTKMLVRNAMLQFLGGY